MWREATLSPELLLPEGWQGTWRETNLEKFVEVKSERVSPGMGNQKAVWELKWPVTRCRINLLTTTECECLRHVASLSILQKATMSLSRQAGTAPRGMPGSVLHLWLGQQTDETRQPSGHWAMRLLQVLVLLSWIRHFYF